MTWTLRWPMLTILLLCALPTHLDAQASVKQAKFDEAIDLALQGIKKFREGWNENLVTPLARFQSTRILHQLSNDLDNLAIAKQEFGERVEDALAAHDYTSLHRDAEYLADEIGSLRRRLNRLFSFMPNGFAQEAGKIETGLNAGLSQKLASLRDVENELNIETPSAEKIKQSTAASIKLLGKLKTQVDSLADEISSGRSR